MEAKSMVMVPVPEDMVTDVYRFIVEETGRRQGGKIVEEPGRRGEVETTQKNGQPQLPDRRPWSKEELAHVLEHGTRAVKLMLPYLAKRPDQVVRGQELAEHVYGPGGRMQQLGGALGSFTRTANTRYRHYNWPFEAVRNEEERAWDYTMDEATATLVRELTDE